MPNFITSFCSSVIKLSISIPAPQRPQIISSSFSFGWKSGPYGTRIRRTSFVDFRGIPIRCHFVYLCTTHGFSFEIIIGTRRFVKLDTYLERYANGVKKKNTLSYSDSLSYLMERGELNKRVLLVIFISITRMQWFGFGKNYNFLKSF